MSVDTMRILELEVAMLEAARADPAAGDRAIAGLGRRTRLNWRLKALHDCRKWRARLELLARLAMAATLATWRRSAWSRLRLALLRWRR